MIDSRTGLDSKTKSELLKCLLREVREWQGLEPLGREREARMRDVSEALYRCSLFIGERYLLQLSDTWLSRASRRPDDWLRELWLSTLLLWQRYVDVSGDAPDSLPGPPTPSGPALQPIDVNPDKRFGHLPFGFVKPLV